MGGGHERANPRGSVGGRKLPGDQLAEAVHGRRGMNKIRRRKGQFQQQLESGERETTSSLNDDEFQLIYFLHVRNKYCPLILTFDDYVTELNVIGVAEASSKADDLVRDLQRKTNGWLYYISCHSLCLRKEHASEIQKFIEEYLEANKGI